MDTCKRLTLLVGAFLLAGLFAYATGTQEKTPAASGPTLELLWMGHPHVLTEPVPPEGNVTQKLIEQRFNVKITNVPVTINNNEALMLYFAEGKTADLINVFGQNVMETLANQGLLRTIPEEWLYTYMPGWMSKMESFFGKELIANQLKYNGKVWGPPGSNYAQTTPNFLIARKDWMDKLGVKENPKTLEDAFALAKKFTFDDPDGNGKKDTYALHGANLSLVYIFGAFGIQSGAYYLRDGKVVASHILPEYRDALMELARWYREGVMDPEYVTDDRTKQRNKWSEGKLGYLGDHPWWMAESTPQNVVKILTDKNPNAKIALLEPFIGPNGKSGGLLGYPVIRGQIGFYFGHKTSDEKVKRIMQIKEAIAMDHTLFVATNHGIEGTHWTRKNGYIVLNPDVTPSQRNKDGLGQYYGLIPITFDDYKDFIPPGDMLYYAHARKIPYVWSGIAFPYAGTNKAAGTKGADVNTIFSEFAVGVITGKINASTEWNGYVERIRKAGLDEIVAEYQKLYEATK